MSQTLCFSTSSSSHAAGAASSPGPSPRPPPRRHSKPPAPPPPLPPPPLHPLSSSPPPLPPKSKHSHGGHKPRSASCPLHEPDHVMMDFGEGGGGSGHSRRPNYSPVSSQAHMLQWNTKKKSQQQQSHKSATVPVVENNCVVRQPRPGREVIDLTSGLVPSGAVGIDGKKSHHHHHHTSSGHRSKRPAPRRAQIQPTNSQSMLQSLACTCGTHQQSVADMDLVFNPLSAAVRAESEGQCTCVGLMTSLAYQQQQPSGIIPPGTPSSMSMGRSRNHRHHPHQPTTLPQGRRSKTPPAKVHDEHHQALLSGPSSGAATTVWLKPPELVSSHETLCSSVICPTTIGRAGLGIREKLTQRLVRIFRPSSAVQEPPTPPPRLKKEELSPLHLQRRSRSESRPPPPFPECCKHCCCQRGCSHHVVVPAPRHHHRNHHHHHRTNSHVHSTPPPPTLTSSSSSSSGVSSLSAPPPPQPPTPPPVVPRSQRPLPQPQPPVSQPPTPVQQAPPVIPSPILQPQPPITPRPIRPQSRRVNEGPNPTSFVPIIDQRTLTFIDNMCILRRMGWYWGPLSFEDAEKLLAGKRDGTFLVRDSAHESYILSLSFRARAMTYHTRIEHTGGKFSFWSQPESHSASTIVEFIEKAVEHSKNGKFHYFLQTDVQGQPPIQVSLLYPMSRFQRVQSLSHMCRFEILSNVRRDHIAHLPLPCKIKEYLSVKQYYAERLEDFAAEEPLSDLTPASVTLEAFNAGHLHHQRTAT